MGEDQSPNDAKDEDFDQYEADLLTTGQIPQQPSGNPRIWRKYLRKSMNLFFLGNIQRKESKSFSNPDVDAIFSKLDRAVDLEFCKAFFFFFGKYGMLVYEFIFKVLGRFERKLPHISIHQTIEHHGMVRGRILWKESFDRWFTRECMDFSALTCQSPIKIFDTPENLLLRYILVQLIDLLENLTEFMDKYTVKGITVGFPVNSDKNTFLEILQEMQREITEVLANSYLRRLLLEPVLSPQLLNKCEHSRNPDVRQFLVPLYDHLNDLTTNQNLAALNDIVRNTLLEIMPENTLFEIFVLFRVLEAIGGKSWPQKAKDIGLIRRGRDHIAYFQQLEGYDEIIVFYNLSFARLGMYIDQNYVNTPQSTSFSAVLQNNAKELVKTLQNPKLITRSFFKPYADLKAKSGRPDIAILYRSGEELFLKIVEVKNTKSENKNYIYRAINSTFIYAANYPAIFSPQAQKMRNPNVLLALNFGPSIPHFEIPNSAEHESLAIINFANVLDPIQGGLQIFQDLLEIPKNK